MSTTAERERATWARVHGPLQANRHADVRLGGTTLDGDTRRVLGGSLATFQLGESGTGEHLFAAAAAAGVSADHLADLRAFIAEEQEHARLLELVLDALGHPLRTSHWTDAAFVVVRRSRSLRAEVLTLLVAEVIAIRYYGALRDGVADPAIAAVCGRIHEDELRHVAFHGETLPAYLRTMRRPARALARGLWNTLVAGTSVVVAVDHGAALRRAGCRRRDFVADVHRLRRDLDRVLFCTPGVPTT